MAGGSIRVGEDDGTDIVGVVIQIDFETAVERYRAEINIKQPAVRGVEAVGYVRKGQWLLLTQQGHKHMGQHFVRTVAYKNMLGRHTVITRYGFLQRGGVG